MAVLVARNLWRSYGRKPAVQGLDLEVEAGSAYGFIGPNGAGKTTTLRLLATLDRPDAGRVWIEGRDAFQDPDAIRPRLGFMPDPFHLQEAMRVEELLEVFAVAYQVPRAQRGVRVERAIELTRIGGRRRQPIKSLSKGWRQRVLLAKTLVHDPALLLLDEPASGLDPAARIEFREVVRTLRELGKAVVVSSHILTELADFCDAVGIIERGRMLVSGQIADILERLDPSDRLELEVPGDPAQAVALLEARPDVLSVRTDAGAAPGLRRVRAAMRGRTDGAARAELLAALVAAGVRVSGFACRRESLEDLFLRVAGAGARGGARLLSAEAMRALLGASGPADAADAGAADEGAAHEGAAHEGAAHEGAADERGLADTFGVAPADRRAATGDGAS